jgi:hypothetical protein
MRWDLTGDGGIHLACTANAAGVPATCYDSGTTMERIDPLGQRETALDAFLEQKVAEGFGIETHTETHAIIVERPHRQWARLRGGEGARFVVEVDEHGAVTMSPAEPKRS